MKQYVIDELRPADYRTLKSYLDDIHGPAAMDGVYWIKVEADLLTEIQAAHQECRPYYFALELENSRLSCEFLVRSKNRMRCDCIHYATRNQRDWLIDFVDKIFERLEIKT
jgi:hypothetical protein